MKKIRLAFLLFWPVAAALVAACSSTGRRAAPIIEHGPAPKAVEHAKPKTAEGRGPEGRGYYTVKKGDTLYRIAGEFGQNYRDLVAWNNLSSANDIKVDQVLRVLPPETGSAQAGTQTGSVSVNSGVEVRALASATASSPVAVAPQKSGPRGEKRPYSEVAFTELQKGDALATPDTRADAAKGSDAKPADKPAESRGAVPETEHAANWMWPAEGKIIGGFSSGKKGIDIAGKLGQPIYAASPGTVLYASSVRGYGNLVIVKHSSNLLSAYAHNKTILVKEGQTVSKGQKIAEMGNSDTDAVKLHFEIRQQGKPVDPSKFLPNR
jgi:lipoprotein NlpD